MNKTTHILSAILALPYFVLGLNYFFNFIPMPPMEGNPGTFLGLLFSTGYLGVVKILEVLLSIMLAFNLARPLALILIAPIGINILLFELFIAQMPGIGILLVVLNAVLIYLYRARYMSIVQG